MVLRELKLSGFKSFAKETSIHFKSPITAIVGPNGSGKSNIADAFRFVLGEGSTKSLRGERPEDIIWSGSSTHPRNNRALATLLLSNEKKHFDLPYDSILLERCLNRDRTSEYKVNGSQIRRKDNTKIISGGNFGPSRHNIIAQGEADRLLQLSPEDLARVFEDALGLRPLFLEKKEALSKIERAHTSAEELEIILRQELPQLKTLERELLRIQEMQERRNALTCLGQEYILLKTRLIDEKRQEAERRSSQALEVLNSLNVEEVVEEGVDYEGEYKRILNEARLAVKNIETDLRTLERRKNELLLERERLNIVEVVRSERIMLAREDLDVIVREIQNLENSEDSISFINQSKRILEILKSFFKVKTPSEDKSEEKSNRLLEIEEELRDLDGVFESGRLALKDAEEKENSAIEMLSSVAERIQIREEKKNVRGSAERELEAANRLQAEAERESETLTRDADELRAICGMNVIRFDESTLELSGAPLETIRRTIDRELGQLSQYEFPNVKSLEKEYADLRARVDMVERELGDMREAEEKARHIVEDLDNSLRIRFTEGVGEIGKRFSKHFETMFGGGNAALSIIEDEEGLPGIVIDVDLPFKRVRGFSSLSGGERTLVSLALLFSIVLFNPPPFVILDETDAALDEANSRRYGDLLEELSKHTELVLITHNREIMARAGTLYGVTMGKDGISRLLSITLEG